VQWFHAEIGTFHLSCGEYVVIPLDWTAILGLRFGEEPVLTKFVSFAMASKLLGNLYLLAKTTRGYFGPTKEPQIRIRWLEENIPWVAKLDDVTLRQFFFYFIGNCLLGNNRSVLTCRLLVAIRVVSVIGAYDWGSLFYGIFIAYLR